jgi:hypothetical protein
VVTYSPWLTMSFSASPTSLYTSGASTLTASINTNSNNATGFTAPDGTPVTFAGTPGAISPSSRTLTSGTTTTTYTAGSTAGSASVSATIDNQTLSASLSVTLSPAPTLTSISPNSGLQGAAVPVTLTGANFISGATVSTTNSGVTVSNVTVVSATQITATFTIASNAAPGAANVTVLTSGGTSSPVTFTVNSPPTLTSISPTTGVQATAVPVTLTGTNFVSGAAVSTTNSGITVSNVTVASPTQITATFTIAANATLGAANVTITTSGGTSAPIPFTINPLPPTITSITPNSGAVSNTYALTLTGTNFVPGATVAITNPGVHIIGVNVTSTTQISAILFSSGTIDYVGNAAVTVTTTGGTSNPVTFTVTSSPPAITSISPAIGGQGTTLTVSLPGYCFYADATISTDNAGITVGNLTRTGTTLMTASFAIAANAPLGTAHVTVTTNMGTSQPVAFTVVPPPPTLTSISPTSGVQATAVPVTLTGTNFISGATVSTTNSGITVSNVTVVSATQINASFTIAANATLGAANVTVTTSGGTSAASAFTVLPPPTGTASFVKTDTTTSGSWRGIYGAEGYNIINASSAYPSYVTVSASGNSSYTFTASTTDPRGTQKPSPATDRIAAGWYSSSSFSADLAFNDSATHQVAVYLLDWDGYGGGRSERVDVLDANGTVLDTRNVSSFGNGQYLVWNLTGHVIVSVTNTNSASNALMSAILFGGSGSTTPPTATFVKTDTTTSGTWRGVYGLDGYNVIGDAASYPAYVTVTPAGNSNYTWLASTTDPRAPQKAPPATDRIASCWYSSTTVSLDVLFSDANTHQFALYLLDWDQYGGGRTERVDILDGSGNVLDTRSVSNFANGLYLVWNLSGHVVVRITNTNAASNGLLNGLFFR